MLGVFYIKRKGKLELINDITEQEYSWVLENKKYNRGKYFFEYDNIPRCKICGEPLIFILKCGRKLKGNNFLVIDGCSNINCKTNNNALKKGNPIFNEAFLPSEIIDSVSKLRKTNNSFNINYLISRGYTKDEADNYILQQKEQRKENGKKNKGQNKLQCYINKYGEELGKQKFNEESCLRIDHWLVRGYTEEDAKQKISDIQKNNAKKVKHHYGLSKEYCKNILMIDDVNLYMKQKSYFSKEYWIKRGYSEEDAINKVADIQSKNSKKRNPDSYKQHSIRCVEYWINKGYSEEDAIEIIKNNQATFSLNKCIEKYGEILGKQIFTERQINWQTTLHNNGNLHVGYSKVSQILFDTLIEYYKKSDISYIYYGTHNKEYSIYDYNNKKLFVYDFTDTLNKKIIEFNGNIFHANPKLFNENDTPHPFNKTKLAKDIWARDNQKIELAKSNGFDVLTIWEDDFHNNYENVLNECKNFLNLK